MGRQAEMSARPTASVYTVKDGKALSVRQTAVPAVFSVRVRPDIVKAVVDRLQLSTRQAQGVKYDAGYQTAAQSWGTGRAVARVPRVPGGGSHRSGQAAFANFCRGGGMFAPNMTWRRWARKTNQNDRRHAQAFSYSASGTVGLVMAKGHRISNIPELPLVVTADIEKITRTKQAHDFLIGLGLEEELTRCNEQKRIRAGKGKGRGRKFKTPRGPLFVVCDGRELKKATAMITGVDVMTVDQPRTRLLAPGHRAGRLVIYSETAFARLAELYGNEQGVAPLKPGYKLPRCSMTADSLHKVINSDAIQSVIRPKMINPMEALSKKGPKPNPLRNAAAMLKLNPAVAEIKATQKKLMK